MGLLIISLLFGLIGSLVSKRLQNKFNKYSQERLSSGLSGAEVAQKMLRDNNIYDVTIQSVPGKLTDHYNPTNKTVNLSPEVYSGRSIAAAAVAAHEVGHAIQHAESYAFLTMRSKLVPVVNVASKMMNFLMMFGVFAFFVISQSTWILGAIIIAQAALTLFSVITLPVEFDASKRAVNYVYGSGMVKPGAEWSGVKDALKWAGMTYFVAALGSLAQLLYLVMIFMGRDD